ncbi:MAG: hypothetical protein PWP53_4261, partial [Lacrimispora sp.]|nr:hypothetical protein [Lacrimispora sp.]
YKMTCGSAGIGRQARLRILWLYDRVGSSPISRIGKQFFIREELLFLYKGKYGSQPELKQVLIK